MDDPKIIAYYLPQYHPFPENDEWWGKGFTEWTNVAKAKPLFRGHYQPKIPADLGFYDLRLPIVREQQAELAKQAGISGFCYWHYWFGNGKRLMERVFDEVLESGSPDFPFCLAWANHSWYAKLWNKDDTSKDRLLIEQTYPGEDDIRMHFEYLVKAFKDSRYIKINGCPLFVIFNPHDCPDYYIMRFQELAKANGFKNGLFIVGNITKRGEKLESLIEKGYSAVTYQRLTSPPRNTLISRTKGYFKRKLLYLIKRPHISDYRKASSYLLNPDVDIKESVVPTILPNWDHTPRSGYKGSVFIHATPKEFYKLVKKCLSMIRNKNNKIVFLKSWNEWGEGNYMEPDLKYGLGYIEALRKALKENK